MKPITFVLTGIATLVLTFAGAGPAHAAACDVKSDQLGQAPAALKMTTQLCAVYTDGGATLNFRANGSVVNILDNNRTDYCQTFMKITFNGVTQYNSAGSRYFPAAGKPCYAGALSVNLRKPPRGTAVVALARTDAHFLPGSILLFLTGTNAQRLFSAV